MTSNGKRLDFKNISVFYEVKTSWEMNHNILTLEVGDTLSRIFILLPQNNVQHQISHEQPRECQAS